MRAHNPISVAIVDYGLGNLFSVRQACDHAGMTAIITSDVADLLAADAIVLPGVGAFGNAMAALRRLDLVAPLSDAAAAGRPVIGICLGLQLLMTESCEFGQHRGLGLLEGCVERFPSADRSGVRVKIPQVGWNRVWPGGEGQPSAGSSPVLWSGTPLEGLSAGEPFYFVHSYYVRPANPAIVLSQTTYADTTFASTVRQSNIFACQYHPERSGAQGLRIYDSLISFVTKTNQAKENLNV